MQINIEPFPNVKPDKAQVMKIVEEAMEVFSAWEDWVDDLNPKSREEYLLLECADVIQAASNLVVALGVDEEGFAMCMEMCTAKNRRRGRYDSAENAKR